MYFLHAFRHLHAHSQKNIYTYNCIYAFPPILRLYWHKKKRGLLIYAFSFKK